MKRREFIAVLGGAAAWPFTARAQQSERMRRVGVLMGGNRDDAETEARLEALQSGLKEFGWIEGRTPSWLGDTVRLLLVQFIITFR